MLGDAPKTILIIEDSPVVQRLFRATLASLEGVDLFFADDGEAGLGAALDLRPDAIMLDIGLPKLDGWQVLSELRANPATEHIGVLVVTAHAQPVFAREAEERGADGFMTKPFRPDDLRLQVRLMLDELALSAAS